MKYESTIIRCTFDKTKKEYNKPDLTPPKGEDGWTVINFQPLASSTPFDSSYLVIWEREN